MLQDTSSTDDLVGLNNLVANTAYLRAQQVDSKELRKQRLSLMLPRLRTSSAIPPNMVMDFWSLCEQQPIGKKLFQQFLLASGPQYVAAAEFLEELNRWSFAEDRTREKARLSILRKFIQPRSRSFLSYLAGEGSDECKGWSENSWDEQTMERLSEATRDFLKGKPFSDYLKSPYFYKFLQWKEYEKQKITGKYFYEFRTLGKGGFGEVCAVQVKHTGQMYACKKLDKRRLKKKSSERLALLEKQILEKVDSLFVVNLAYAYDNKTHLCLIMDLMNGGDLKFHIYELGKRGIRMERVIYYVAQITMGILHLHSMEIVYRDMKPENVLLDARGQCRLSDLGLAVELPKGKKICQKTTKVKLEVDDSGERFLTVTFTVDGQKLRRTFGHQVSVSNGTAGTTGYMAPEILRQENYSMSVDWWALGCSIYEMVAARLPFKDFKEKVQNEEVTRRTLEDECKYDHKHFNAPTKDIISRLLKKRVQNRLGCRAEDPQNHVFFSSINFRRLEAGLIEPPWVPKPNVVYAKNLDELRDTSEVEDIQFDTKDEMFFREFSTGAVPVRWQREMIDSGVFDELNSLEPNGHKAVGVSRTCVIL